MFGVAYLDAATARVSIGRLEDDDRMSNLSSLIFLLKPKEIVYASVRTRMHSVRFGSLTGYAIGTAFSCGVEALQRSILYADGTLTCG